MDTNLNYYELLGVKEDATEDEIKIAYKKQMKKWHPDINKDAEAVTISARINEAKEILLDPVKRYDYNEYLKKKINENYNRYTQRKKNEQNNAYSNENGKTYEDEKVTKWQYLKTWLKFARVSKIRKTFGVIGVLLETFLCFILKCLIIIIAYISTLGSYFIRVLYSMLAPIIGLLLVLFIGMCFTNGFKETITDNNGTFNAIIIIFLVYVASFLLPVLTNILLSPKTFNILYNKIDINLFKMCVGYKD